MLRRDYSISSDGSIIHHAASKLRVDNQKHAFGFYHPVFVVTLLLMFFALDLVMNISLFDALLSDNVVLRVLSIAAILTGLDIAPIYLGRELKAHNYYKRYGIQKKDGKIGIVVFSVAFVLAFTAYCFLRIVTKDIVMPNLENVNSIFGDVSVTDDVNEIALPYAIAACVFPLITSLASFGVSYITAVDPIKSDLEKVTKKLIKTDQLINRYESQVDDYNQHNDYKEFILEKDFQEFQTEVANAKLRCIELADMVRREIAVRIQDPVAVNNLTKAATESFINLSKEFDDLLVSSENMKYMNPAKQGNVLLPKNQYSNTYEYEYDALPTNTSVYITSNSGEGA